MKDIQRITSFTVDHDFLIPGIYISRVDGDITTYDLRTRIPNGGAYMDSRTMHSVEHMFATYVRNSDIADDVIYFGPMGCRTGFYFLVRDAVSHEQAIQLTKDAFAFIASYEGEIPGVSAVECGNWRDHDLQGAVNEARVFSPIIAEWTVEKLNY